MKTIHQEYARKWAVGVDLARIAWKRDGLDGVQEELASLLRLDADPVVIAAVQNVYHWEIKAAFEKRAAAK